MKTCFLKGEVVGLLILMGIKIILNSSLTIKRPLQKIILPLILGVSGPRYRMQVLQQIICLLYIMHCRLETQRIRIKRNCWVMIWKTAEQTIADEGYMKISYLGGICLIILMIMIRLYTNGQLSNKLRIVSGYSNYKSEAPVAHTVLLYDPNGEFETTLNSDSNGSYTTFTNEDAIDVIDLTNELNGDAYYTMSEYNDAFNHFEPVYSIDNKDSSSADNVSFYGDHTPFDLMAYESGVSQAVKDSPFYTINEPQGPNNLGSSSNPLSSTFVDTGTSVGNLDIWIDQTSGIQPVLFAENSSTVDVIEIILDDFILFGIRSYTMTHPFDDTLGDIEVDLSGVNVNDTDIDNSSPSNMNSDAERITLGSYSAVESEVDDQDETDDSYHEDYDSSAVVSSGTSSSGSSGAYLNNSSDIILGNMTDLLRHEFEEKAIFMDMYEVSNNPLDVLKNDTDDDLYLYNVIDWPQFQALQRRLFNVHQNMKKIYLVMKLKADFLSLIGTRLSGEERQQLSAAMDSIFNSRFEDSEDIVSCIRGVYHRCKAIMIITLINQARKRSIWDFSFSTIIEGVIAGHCSGW